VLNGAERGLWRRVLAWFGFGFGIREDPSHTLAAASGLDILLQDYLDEPLVQVHGCRYHRRRETPVRELDNPRYVPLVIPLQLALALAPAPGLEAGLEAYDDASYFFERFRNPLVPQQSNGIERTLGFAHARLREESPSDSEHHRALMVAYPEIPEEARRRLVAWQLDEEP